MEKRVDDLRLRLVTTAYPESAGIFVAVFEPKKRKKSATYCWKPGTDCEGIPYYTCQLVSGAFSYGYSLSEVKKPVAQFCEEIYKVYTDGPVWTAI
jgi:hypothetical protein